MLNQIIKPLRLTALAVAIGLGSSANAGIPVIDAGSIAQAVIQVQQQVQEIEQAYNTVKSQTGNSLLGSVVNDPKLNAEVKRVLGIDSASLNGAVSASDLTAALKQIAAARDASGKLSPTQAKAKELEAIAKGQVLLNQTFGIIEGRTQSLEALMGQINRTTDLASKADLANTLQAQQAMVTIDIQRAGLAMEAQKMRLEQAREASYKSAAIYSGWGSKK